MRIAAFMFLLSLLPAASAFETGADVAQNFADQVARRLDLPAEEREAYGQRLSDVLARAGLGELQPQFFVLVDRDPHVQAAMIYWKSPAGAYAFIGASPASTGRPGAYEHFETPTGVFEHSTANFDFRAEGTKNEYGIRGYGQRGMRVYDFGWVTTERGWGRPGQSPMRLQMHATDPDLLEPQLGLTHSKGCIRIPAAFDVFVDRYGILDADYERARAQGHRVWVLRADRIETPWSGRYLVVVDSERAARPAWSPPRGRRVSAAGREDSEGSGATSAAVPASASCCGC
jgi:hypothetical protein